MAKIDFVDGDGWVSDESSFYGDEDVCTRMEEEAARELSLPYFPFAHITAKRTEGPFASPHGQTGHLKASSDAAAEEAIPPVRQDVPRTKTTVQISKSTEAADFLQNERLNDLSASWQHDETIEAFLERHPVADPKTARVGPWLWVSNPKLSESMKAHRQTEDLESFTEQAGKLLMAFSEQKAKEDGNDAHSAKLNRHQRMRRDQLEEDLLVAAVRSGTTCGKWMLFPGSENLEKYWAKVASATSTGRLGPVSKVATPDFSSDKDETLICVYTYDFSDLKDVRRVLTELLDLGLCTKAGKPIYYKCDAYTYLNITSNNSYNLRASLFSSKEVLGNDARILEDGPIARVKKRVSK